MNPGPPDSGSLPCGRWELNGIPLLHFPRTRLLRPAAPPPGSEGQGLEGSPTEMPESGWGAPGRREGRLPAPLRGSRAAAPPASSSCCSASPLHPPSSPPPPCSSPTGRMALLRGRAEVAKLGNLTGRRSRASGRHLPPPTMKEGNIESRPRPGQTSPPANPKPAPASAPPTSKGGPSLCSRPAPVRRGPLTLTPPPR